MSLLDAPAFALPETVAEAVAARAARPAAAFVAGGTELMPDMLWRTAAPGGFVALRRVPELAGAEVRDGSLRIGAGTTAAALLRDPVLTAAPGLARAAASLGTPLVRAAATIGGNVMSAQPYRNLLPVLLALGARLELRSADGVRELPFEGFVSAPGVTAARSGELLTAVEVPVLPGVQDYVKVGPRNAQFVATASCAIVLDTAARAVRFGFGNAGPVPLRVPEADELATAAVDWDTGALGDPAALDALAEAVRAGVDPPTDPAASAGYRRHALAVLARRLLVRATGGES